MKTKRFLVLAALLFSLLVVLTGINFSADDKKNSEDSKGKAGVQVSWNDFEKGVELARKQKKLLVIDFYTNWCHWCKVMDKETYGNDEIVALDGKKALFAKINAESQDRVTFRGSTYSGPELAMMFGVRGYPSTAFLSGEGELLTTVSGYIPADRFKMILRYFADNHYQTMEWKDFVAKESES